MEDIKCIFCNKSSNQIVIEENGYKGRKCPDCDLIYISPRPTLSEIQNVYTHDQAHISAESHISGNFVKMLYAKHNLKIIRKFIKKGSMLEIGAGAGYFLDEMRKEGFEVYGIELNKDLANFIRNELEIPCEETPLDVSSFLFEKKIDIIYHCDVISHFYDPIAEFQKFNAKLKKAGIVVFETGNFGDMEEKYYRYIKRFQYPDHLFFFSESSLKELLARTGFEFITIYRYSILPELKILKYLKNIINFLKFSGKNTIKKIDNKNVSSNSTYNPTGLSLKQLIENTYHYFIYLIRYKLGYVMPKKGRPQTVIVIARKKN